MKRAKFLCRYQSATYYRVTDSNGNTAEVCVLDSDGTHRRGPSVDFPEASPEDVAAVSAFQREEGRRNMQYFANNPDLAIAAFDMGLLPNSHTVTC